MDRTLLVTTGNGMFGRALIEDLLGDGQIAVRAMVRDRGKFELQAPNLDVVVADMDRPETLGAALDGVTHVFLSTPMDERIAARESAVIAAAQAAGSPHVLKLFGAVKHESDELSSQHADALSVLEKSGLPWTLISPNSVMETSLAPYAEQFKWDCMFGMSGHGKVGLVSAEDVAGVTAAVVRGGAHEGRNYELTGPEALDLFEMAAVFSDILGRRIAYYDMTEADFAKQLMDNMKGATPEWLEINVLCHLRAWRDGKADLVTDTVRELTGRPAMSLKDWAAARKTQFDLPRHLSDKAMTKMIAMRFGEHGKKH
jgi:uncharacterized protein YbjT (DUF2867 family)